MVLIKHGSSLEPCKPEGHFQRKMGTTLGHHKQVRELQYLLDVPSHNRCNVDKEVRTLPNISHHEACEEVKYAPRGRK